MTDQARRAGDLPYLRPALYVLLALMPVMFIAGRVTEPERFTIRQAEAAPVPRALPLGVETFHDASAEVTCWRDKSSGSSRGLSCLPDQWLASARAQGGE